MRTRIASLCFLILSSTIFVYSQDDACGSGGPSAAPDPIVAQMRLSVVRQEPAPVITPDSPGADGNSFEGGMVVKVKGVYRLFSTEHRDDVRTKLAEWTSPDRIHWTRLGTIFQLTGDQTGTDPRASLWSPLMLFDEEHQLWNMFYIGYFSKPNTKEKWYANYDGYVIRAISEKPGVEGIDGPYKDVANLVRPSEESLPWEGLQGTDSFFPYKVGDRWLAFYGSANTEVIPCPKWRVGLAAAPTLGGPWSRCPRFSPSPIESQMIENPIVYSVDRVYIAIYDVDEDDHHAVGYAFSGDGVNWPQGKKLIVVPGPNFRSSTPLSLIPEEDGTYSLFYTAFDSDYHPRVSTGSDRVENVYLAIVRTDRGADAARQ